MKTIKENKIQCKYCNEIIISENRHDFKWCKCKKVAIDGGKDYLKRTCMKRDDYIDLSTYKK